MRDLREQPACLSNVRGVNLPNDYQLILNANMTFAIDGAGSAFEPAIRFVKRINDRWTVGIEHFSNFGQGGRPDRGEGHRSDRLHEMRQ
jgi:hypothetical protein